MTKTKKIILAVILVILLLLMVVCTYFLYVMLSMYRVDDNLALEIDGSKNSVLSSDKAYNDELSIITWNIGFGAYSDDYSFFMDGGEYSRAFSKDAVIDNTNGVTDILSSYDADFMYVQEVDVDSTRSYHVDQTDMLENHFNKYSNVFAQNYDSPYLFYPLLSPIGKSLSGIMTFSKYYISSSLRRSLPIESGIMKVVDLDRCYSITEVKIDDGNTLYLYNIHLSAYTSDGTIATEQLKMLLEDMREKYESGGYIVCGGDFNKDLLGDSSAVFGVSGEEYTWAQPFPTELLPSGFKLVSSLNEEDPVATCRNTDKPYVEGECFVLIVDGFIVSDNITVNSCSGIDTGFKYTDHNPVYMSFTLNK